MDSAWIGLRKDDQIFVWLDGVTATRKTVGRADSEPSNDDSENCARVYHWNQPFSTANNIRCNRQNHGLCEKLLFT